VGHTGIAYRLIIRLFEIIKKQIFG
jgi:hypothetical protein